jgi:hypothetical protein
MAEDRTIDQDVAEGVELAEVGPGFQRKVGEVAGPRRAPKPEVADEDTHIVREDLGPDSVTFVAAGDPIPADLAGLPRRPARGGQRKRG